jgi:tetratricopeptide (TPR) repeat protein
LAVAISSQGLRQSPDALARRRFEREPTEDSKANDLFLRGVYSHRLGGESNYLDARRFLSQAVARDPTFALAHVALASTFTVMAVDGYERPALAWPESNRSTRRALEIDPELPEAHAEQSSSWFFFDHDWTAAEREWNLALRSGSSPVLPDLLAAAAVKIWALGRTEDALVLMRQARSLDPLTPRFAVQQADLLSYAGRFEEAVQAYTDVLERMEDASACFGLAEARRGQRQFELAIAARRRAHEASDRGAIERLAPVFDRAQGEKGYREIERATVELELENLDGLRSGGDYVSSLDVARVYAQLGDADRAFHYLDGAFEENSCGLVFLNVDRAWALVRGEARFAAAVKAVGLEAT